MSVLPVWEAGSGERGAGKGEAVVPAMTNASITAGASHSRAAMLITLMAYFITPAKGAQRSTPRPLKATHSTLVSLGFLCVLYDLFSIRFQPVF